MIMPASDSSVSHYPSIQSLNHAPAARSRIRLPLYFFLDFSNIAISAAQVGQEFGDGILCSGRVRIHSGNLREFVERGRNWKSGFAVAGLANQNSPLKRHFEQSGIQFQICERGCITGAEQNVDERIRMEMLELLDSNTTRGIIVLATGDGNGFQDNRGFIRTLSILKQQGFLIEVMSWRHSFNSNLRVWATANGRVIELDPFYEDLTFIKGGRSATPPHQMKKKLARQRLF